MCGMSFESSDLRLNIQHSTCGNTAQCLSIHKGQATFYTFHCCTYVRMWLFSFLWLFLGLEIKIDLWPGAVCTCAFGRDHIHTSTVHPAYAVQYPLSVFLGVRKNVLSEWLVKIPVPDLGLLQIQILCYDKSHA